MASLDQEVRLVCGVTQGLAHPLRFCPDLRVIQDTQDPLDFLVLLDNLDALVYQDHPDFREIRVVRELQVPQVSQGSPVKTERGDCQVGMDSQVYRVPLETLAQLG